MPRKGEIGSGDRRQAPTSRTRAGVLVQVLLRRRRLPRGVIAGSAEERRMIATDARERVLIVDDEQGPRESLRMILKPNYDVMVASGGREALQVVKQEQVDLVTLDLNMPGVKGIEVLRALKSELPAIEVIIITGFATVRSAVEGIRYGVHDFITKPFDIAQVMATVERALRKRRALKRLHGFLEGMGNLLGKDKPADQALLAIESDSELLLKMRNAIKDAFTPIASANKDRVFEFVEVLSDTLESKDQYTHGHSRRVSYYASLLAESAGFDADVQEEIRLASFLHDIGKVGVSNRLILKDGKLTTEEHAVVAKHPELGENLILPLGLPLGVVRGVRHHHEQYDGNGYPDRLVGEDIPINSRIILIGDAYDAMRSDRPYRKGFPTEAILREFRKHAGTQFDPDLTAKFVHLLETREDLFNCEV
jgi:response regulator RpfG family c-di-GMP phosphodiesterase